MSISPENSYVISLRAIRSKHVRNDNFHVATWGCDRPTSEHVQLSTAPQSGQLSTAGKHPQPSRKLCLANPACHLKPLLAHRSPLVTPMHENVFPLNAMKKRDIAKDSPLCSGTSFLELFASYFGAHFGALF